MSSLLGLEDQPLLIEYIMSFLTLLQNNMQYEHFKDSLNKFTGSQVNLGWK
jgi:hypothetical protein